MPSAPRGAAAARAGAAVLLAAALAGGCGGGTAAGGDPPSAPAGSAYFEGGGDGGVGAAVDFRGADRPAAALRRALAARGGGAVAIASLVNEGPAAVPVPRVVGEADDGTRVALVPARRALAGRRDRLARRALGVLPPVRRAIPGEGSAVTYLVLRGRRPRELRALLLEPVVGEAVELRARPR